MDATSFPESVMLSQTKQMFGDGLFGPKLATSSFLEKGNLSSIDNQASIMGTDTAIAKVRIRINFHKSLIGTPVSNYK
jgi:hypothetical protein